MKRGIQVLLVVAALTIVSGAAAAETLVLRDFDGESTRAGDVLRDKATKRDIASAYKGPLSTSVITMESDRTAAGKQALHVEWDNKDWAGVGIGLTSKFYITEGYTTFKMSMRGEGKGQRMNIQLFDKGNEIHTITIDDDSEDWKVLEIPFTDFQVREDYQPAGAKKDGILNFPVRSINIESASGGAFDFWIDQIEIVK